MFGTRSILKMTISCRKNIYCSIRYISFSTTGKLKTMQMVHWRKNKISLLFSFDRRSFSTSYRLPSLYPTNVVQTRPQVASCCASLHFLFFLFSSLLLYWRLHMILLIVHLFYFRIKLSSLFFGLTIYLQIIISEKTHNLSSIVFIVAHICPAYKRYWSNQNSE